jgi:hypothetical protein
VGRLEDRTVPTDPFPNIAGPALLIDLALKHGYIIGTEGADTVMVTTAPNGGLICTYNGQNLVPKFLLNQGPPQRGPPQQGPVPIDSFFVFLRGGIDKLDYTNDVISHVVVDAGEGNDEVNVVQPITTVALHLDLSLGGGDDKLVTTITAPAGVVMTTEAGAGNDTVIARIGQGSPPPPDVFRPVDLFFGLGDGNDALTLNVEAVDPLRLRVSGGAGRDSIFANVLLKPPPIVASAPTGAGTSVHIDSGLEDDAVIARIKQGSTRPVDLFFGLGDGNDTLTANVEAVDPLSLRVSGGAGGDNIFANVVVQGGGSSSFDLGGGNDVITADFTKVEGGSQPVDFRVAIAGGDGNDVIRARALTVIHQTVDLQPMRPLGPGPGQGAFVLVDGGSGWDFCWAFGMVTVVNCEVVVGPN